MPLHSPGRPGRCKQKRQRRNSAAQAPASEPSWQSQIYSEQDPHRHVDLISLPAIVEDRKRACLAILHLHHQVRTRTVKHVAERRAIARDEVRSIARRLVAEIANIGGKWI